MKNSKSLLELSREIEILNETAQGQLRGGFAVLHSSGLIELEEATNNCTIKNKNRGKQCSGCSTTKN